MEPLASHGVRLAWNPDGTVTHAEGACELVLGQTATALTGQPLHDALAVAPIRALPLIDGGLTAGPVHFLIMDTRSQEATLASHEPLQTYLRVELGRSDAGPFAQVLNLSALLKGAPPLQISRLSSSLSHELRNPLSSVKMAVQTLARNPGHSERDQRRLTIAQREIRTIERMLWMLSEYGRDTPPHLEVVPLRAFLQQAVEMIDRELTERQARVEVTGLHEPPKVRVDTGRLRPVLAQLLLNVAVAGEPQSAVQVRVSASGSSVLLHIEDPTSAFVPEEQETLFEPFGSKLARGAGLSLAALKQVMLRQGGRVSAESGEKSGTVFILTFASAA